MNELLFDNDVKIASDKPSRDFKKNDDFVNQKSPDKQAMKNAKDWGKFVAQKFIEDSKEADQTEKESDGEMLIQRRMLLSFTATVGFEQLCNDDTLSGVAQKSFLDTLKQCDSELYRTSSDTGAFSFYYLAFRRGGEVDRRIGQTFAMLCSHDGDPIYQELGEALYCWFLSEVKKGATKFGLI